MIEAIFIAYCAGYITGSFLRGAAYERQPWRFLRWDPTIFGYRQVVHGTHVNEHDKVFIALELNIPEEGLTYEDR